MGALGYFVDSFDVNLFGIVRVGSLLYSLACAALAGLQETFARDLDFQES